jgi:hypothetical protein
MLEGLQNTPMLVNLIKEGIQDIPNDERSIGNTILTTNKIFAGFQVKQ